jgi:hypothetical protein
MQSTGGSLTSRIESRRYDLVKSILVAHSRSIDGVCSRPTNRPGSLTATKQKAGYKANGTLLIAIFALGFRVSRRLIQAML